MIHYRPGEWADYVRGLRSGACAAEMQGHLETGCSPCTALHDYLTRVAATARRDRADAPSDAVLRSVKAFYAFQRGQTPAGRTVGLRRLFDSALAPATMATRAAESDERQLLFESDEYTLELSVDRSPEAEEAVLRGQLLEAHGEPRSHTPVFLMGGGEVLGRTISEEQGTFEIVGRLVRPCELWVFPDEEHHIKLRLDPEN